MDANKKELAQHVLRLAELYFGLTHEQFRCLAYNFAEDSNIKNNFNSAKKLTGRDRLALFLKWNLTISFRRKSEDISFNRINACNEGAVKRYFQNTENVMENTAFLMETFTVWMKRVIVPSKNQGAFRAKMTKADRNCNFLGT